MRAKGWGEGESFLASRWWDGYDGLEEVEEIYLDEMGGKREEVGGSAGAGSLRRARPPGRLWGWNEGGALAKKAKEKVNYSTQDSRVVPHRGTN